MRIQLPIRVLGLLCCLALPRLHASFGFFADGGTYVILDVDGGGNTYYHLSPTTSGNPTFLGTDLGTFTTGVNTLVLNGFENNTFESDPDGVMNGRLNYRIYLDGSPSGSYTTVNHTVFTPLGSDNKRHDVTDANINILAGLPTGDYVLELYTFADITYDVDPSPEDQIYPENSGDATRYQSAFESPFPYTASFSVINNLGGGTAVTPEPHTAGLLIFSVGILRLLRKKFRI